VIACPEAAESAESLPAEDAEGARAEPAESSASEAVRESPGVGGLKKRGSSSSSLASVSGLSLVPSDELSTVGVHSQFLSSSANTVVSSPLIEISLSQDSQLDVIFVFV